MRTITASFSGGQTFVTTESLWQYDYGFILVLEGLELPAYYEVHFSHTFTQLADVNIGDANGVAIDDKFLRHDGYLYAWVYLHDEVTDGYTKYQVKIPIAKRAQPPEDPPSQEQEEALAQAIAALNEQTGRAEDAAEEAEQHKTDAEDAALLAQSWAEGGTGTRQNEDWENAKFYAQMAQVGAAESGYAYFNMDQETGEIIATVADNLAEDVQFEINEQTGELEVVFL